MRLARIASIGVLISVLLVTAGCLSNPFTAWHQKRVAAQNAKNAAAVKVQVDAYRVAVDTEVAAGKALLKNEQDLAKAEASRHALLTGLVVKSSDLLATVKNPDPTVAAVQILLSYAKLNGDTLSESQMAWLTPIVAQLVAKNQAGEKALADKQAVADAERKVEDSLQAQSAILGQAKAAADVQVQALGAKLNKAETTYASYAKSVSVVLAKHGVWHTVFKDVILCLLVLFGIPALLELLSIPFPVLAPISAVVETGMKALIHVCLLPIHSLTDWLAKRFSPAKTP